MSEEALSAWPGIATELQARGHAVHISPARADLTAALDGADLAIVPVESEPDLVSRAGRHHARAPLYGLLLHDAGHRSLSNPASVAALDLRHYDGVLTVGGAVARLYLERGWAREAWPWPALADVRVFYPRRRPETRGDTADADWTPSAAADGDVVWIGHLGRDEERQAAFEEFFIAPVRRLRARAAVYGGGFTPATLDALHRAGVEYRGWIPRERVPEIFARFHATIYLPGAPYVGALQGIPTASLFEAMACGIPLVSAQWRDVTGVVGDTPFCVAENGAEMTAHLGELLANPALRAEMAGCARRAIHARHTCAHRVDALLAISGAIQQRHERSAASVLVAAT